MKKIEKLFNDVNMSYKNVILFALIAGIYCGLINCVDALHNTSLTDIAVTYEWWVMFALVIVCNSKSPLEAGLKNFLFFIISQPLVYLVEIGLGKLAFERALQYYVQMWLPMTFATFPGGIIAYFAKKQNVAGAIILGLGEVIMVGMGLYYGGCVFKNPPYHLLTVLFCFISWIVSVFAIQKTKEGRWASFVTTGVVVTVIIVFALKNGLQIFG